MSTRLVVRRDGDRVAIIEDRRGRVMVRYDERVLDTTATGVPLLSCSLPVMSTWQDGTAWARGILPEGQHLDSLAARADLRVSDTVGLLARYGRDIAGAFEILNENGGSAHHVEPATVRYTEEELEAEVEGLDTRPLGIHDDSELSLAGLQDKMLIVRTGEDWARPVGGYPSTHILKAEPSNHPGLVAAEAACLRLARAVGLTTIDAIEDRLGGRPVLIVSRFDRKVEQGTSGPGTVRRLHQEDLLQALGLDPRSLHGRAKYQVPLTPGPPSWWHAHDLLDDYARDLPGEARQLLRTVIFTTVIGNADCHAKNVAFLIDDGWIRLAPLYDTVPTLLWEDLRTRAAMSVGDVAEMGRIGSPEIIAEAQRWGVPRVEAVRNVTEFLDQLEGSVSVCGDDRVESIVVRNIGRLRRNLSS